MASQNIHYGNSSGGDVCFFVSDLHGHIDRYEKLFSRMCDEHPRAVFLGGDLFPSGLTVFSSGDRYIPDFAESFLIAEFTRLKGKLGENYPVVFLILGNDDLRSEETVIRAGAETGLWEYLHDRKVFLSEYPVYGYACVPPTPFRLKDWERYDVSRYVDINCLPPVEGVHSVPVSESELKNGTIQNDLQRLAGNDDLSNAVFLFHTPPYQTNLDRAAHDGKMVDHAPLDLNIGSIAVRRFIEARQPLLTLHGHVHEAPRLSGSWKDRIGRTFAFSAAHDGPELALVRFRLSDLEHSSRELL